ncbi:MAG: glycosyltransferase [Candidatus Rokubacteria bacterium]|nr:glycosyltransferase [Candidatus Rokubacteria bacterium]
MTDSVRANGATPVRLLEFLTSFTAGGTERQIVNFMKRLDRRRFALSIGCQMRSGKFVDEVVALGAPLREYTISSFKHPGTLRQMARLARDIRRDRVQIVHSHNFYANVFAVPAARLARAPVVIASVRDMGIYQTPPQRTLHRIVCALADRIIVNADAIRRSLVARGLAAHRISVIPNGLDMTPFERSTRPAIRSELGLAADAAVVVLVARLNALKGVADFLEAAARVVRAVPNARFVIVGDDWTSLRGEVVADTAYRRALARQVGTLGIEPYVVFTGFRRDVPALLAEAAVSVLPSHSEGLSNTLLESMAAGAPVVATDVGGNPEVVRHGITGLLVPPRAPAALADAIVTLLTDAGLADRFRRAGRRRVVEEFSLERMVARTEEMYLDLLARATGLPQPAASEPNQGVSGARQRWSA